jgi:fructokinase
VKNVLNNVKFNEVFSDLNIRAPYYSKETVMLCLENATIVKISDEELPVVCDLVFGRNDFDYKTAARMLSDKFTQLKIVVITRGAEGSYAYDCISGNEFSSAGEKVKVVSTVGAGDSFGAAFLVHYIDGKSIQDCLNIATRVSAYVVAHTEAVPD